VVWQTGLVHPAFYVSLWARNVGWINHGQFVSSELADDKM
jgi:hypothetical protein